MPTHWTETERDVALTILAEHGGITSPIVVEEISIAIGRSVPAVRIQLYRFIIHRKNQYYRGDALISRSNAIKRMEISRKALINNRYELEYNDIQEITGLPKNKQTGNGSFDIPMGSFDLKLMNPVILPTQHGPDLSDSICKYALESILMLFNKDREWYDLPPIDYERFLEFQSGFGVFPDNEYQHWVEYWNKRV